MRFLELPILGKAFICICATGGIAAGQATPLYSIDGDGAGDDFGVSVHGAGDVNNDGFDDFVIGAPELDQSFGRGYARVISGHDGTTLYTFNGASILGAFGTAVAGAGDLDNDGFADVVVGAPSDYESGGSANARGTVRAFSGRDGSVLYRWAADSLGDNFGFSVGAAGDVDNDGRPDVIVGAPLDDNNGQSSGSARVFSGADGSILHTFSGLSGQDGLGGSVSGAGDVDKDGHDDVIAGGSGDYARVYSGRTGALLYHFAADDAGDALGHAVGAAGDVNLDGYDDVIVGARQDDDGATEGGTARVYSGRNGSILYQWNGDTTLGLLGRSVDSGYVDSDSHPDLIVGGNGFAYVYSGATGAELFRLSQPSPYNGFGVSVGSAGDVDGDGLKEILIGIPTDDKNGVFAGAARVFDLVPAVAPTNYCVASLNSRGTRTLMGHAGSTSVSANDLTLTATGAVPGEAVLFFYGVNQTQYPAGNGNFCVGGPIFRINPAGTVGANGNVFRRLDLDQGPFREGNGMVNAGSTWHFQVWYRDQGANGSFRYNFSDGLKVTFMP